MRIKVLKSLAGLDFSYSSGQVIDIDDNIAQEWIAAGLAEAVPIKKAKGGKADADDAG